MTTYLSVAFQYTGYTVIKMLLCLSSSPSSLTIISLNNMEQIHSENLKQKKPI